MTDARANSGRSQDAAGGSPDPAALIELRSISRRFGGVRALTEVNFSIRPGEVHCLAGENGCGKSTLIKILAGVLAPDSGRIVAAGGAHARWSPRESQHAGIQIIYQDLSLFPNLTVAENILFHRHTARPWGLNRPRAMRAAASQVMDRLGLALPVDRKVGELSIAARQLVAICRTLAASARVIVMDEPTASLTHHEADALLATIRGLKAQGIAVVLVSHRLDDMMAVGDRVTVLRDGANVGTLAMKDVTRAQLGELISGQISALQPKARFASAAAPVLAVRGLTRAGEYAAIDLTIRPGEIVGLIGRLGAGRTELALSLFGMTQPDTGEITIDGQPVTLRSNRDAIRRGIGYVSEDRLSRGLVMPQSIAENTVITVLDRLAGRLGLLNEARRKETVSRWIGRLQVKTSTAERAVRELSGGNQQRIVLAKWLATQPRILLLDSPTVGIDVGAKAGLYRAIDELAAQGLGILLISDEVEEVLQQAHRILVMRAGRITAGFDAADVAESQLREAIYA